MTVAGLAKLLQLMPQGSEIKFMTRLGDDGSVNECAIGEVSEFIDWPYGQRRSVVYLEEGS